MASASVEGGGKYPDKMDKERPQNQAEILAKIIQVPTENGLTTLTGGEVEDVAVLEKVTAAIDAKLHMSRIEGDRIYIVFAPLEASAVEGLKGVFNSFIGNPALPSPSLDNSNSIRAKFRRHFIPQTESVLCISLRVPEKGRLLQSFLMTKSDGNLTLSTVTSSPEELLKYIEQQHLVDLGDGFTLLPNTEVGGKLTEVEEYSWPQLEVTITEVEEPMEADTPLPPPKPRLLGLAGKLAARQSNPPSTPDEQ